VKGKTLAKGTKSSPKGQKPAGTKKK
jgi:hypothetical protein